MDSKEVAALFFCIETLQDRAEKDAANAWVWQLKEKVAWSHVAQRERELGIGDGDCPLYSTYKLSAEEREETLRDHPLLKETLGGEMKEPHGLSTEMPSEGRSRLADATTDREGRRHVDSRELSTLYFCIATLLELAGEDAVNSWLWRLKERVAWFRVAQCERELGRDDDDDPLFTTYELSNEERDEIMRNHPLLQRLSASEMNKAHSRHDEWFEEIRVKVEKYTRK